ncbi:hypothetical protein WH52_12610, partial [Tenacibaculum holothuriorum]
MKKKYLLILIALILYSVPNKLFGQTSPNCSVNAGAATTYCEGEEIELNGSGNNRVNESTIQWTQVSGPPINFSDSTIYKPLIIGATGGNTYVFRLTVTCNNGLPTSQDVSITVRNAPTASAGVDILGCPGNYPISGTIPTGPPTFTGTWSIIGNNNAGVSITDPSSASTTINLGEGNAGQTTLEWRVSDGDSSTCDGVSRITVTNIGGVDPVEAGPDVTKSSCFDVNTSHTFNASFGGINIGGQLGQWELVSGPSTPTFNNVNNNQATVSGLIEGVYEFKWKVSGPCVNGEDTVTITVPDPAGSVTNATTLLPNRNIRICDPSVTQLNLDGEPPLKPGETVQWEIVNNPGNTASFSSSSTVTTSTLFTPTVYGLSNTAGGNNATYRFRYTVTSANGLCTDSDIVRVRFVKNTLSVELTDDGTPSECIFATLNAQNEVDVTFGITKENPRINVPTRYQIVSGPITTGIINLGTRNSFTRKFTRIGTYVVRAYREPRGSTDIGCTTASDDIMVKISGTAEGANAGTDQFICSSSFPPNEVSLAGNTVIQGVGTWSKVSGPTGSSEIIENPNSASTKVTNLSNGVYYFRWSISSGPQGELLSSNSDEVKVVVSNSTLTYTNIAGSDVTICAGAYQLDGRDLLENERGKWSLISTNPAGNEAGVTFSSETDPKAIVNGLQKNIQYTFQYELTNGCTNLTDTVTLTVNNNDGPSAANAGDDICTTASTVNLAATIVTGGTGEWVKVSGPIGGNITNINDPTTSITSLQEGNYVYRWSVDGGAACPNNTTSDTVIVSIVPNTPYNAGADQDICGSNTITLSAATPVSQGEWVQTYGSGGWNFAMVSDVNNPNATIQNLSDGIYEFEWRVSTASCATNDKMSFSIANQPTAPNAGADKTICANSGNLEATPVVQGMGVWSFESGPNNPSITDISDPTTEIRGLVTGTYVFKWTTSPNEPPRDPSKPNCNNLVNSDLVTITVVAPANAGGNNSGVINLCGVTQVLLEGTLGSNGTWHYISSSPAGATTPTITYPNGGTSGNIASAVIEPNYEYIFEYRLPSDPACPSLDVDDTVTVRNFEAPDAIAGSDIEVCNLTTTPNMAATSVTSPNRGRWRFISSLSTSGVPTPTFDNNQLATTQVNGLTQPGTYYFRWETDNGTNTCRKSDDMVIIVRPESNAGTDTSMCIVGGTLDAETPTSGTGTWSFVSSTNAALNASDVTFSNNKNPKSNITFSSNVLDNDVITLQWVLNFPDINGVASTCNATDTVNIEVNAATATVLSPLITTNSCFGLNNGTLTTVASAGVAPYTYNLLYSTTAGGTYINSPQTDGDTDGSYTGLQPGFYKVEVQDSQLCGTVTSAPIEVQIDFLCGVSVSSNQIICDGDLPADISVFGVVGGSVEKWQKSESPTFASGITDIMAATTTLSGITIGSLTTTTYFRAVINYGIFGTVYSPVITVTVQDTVTA